jgi:hypothetical protein
MMCSPHNVNNLNVFRGEAADTSAGVMRMMLAAVRDAVVDMVQAGSGAARRGSSAQGEALEWNRLDFLASKTRMELAVATALAGQPEAHSVNEAGR